MGQNLHLMAIQQPFNTNMHKNFPGVELRWHEGKIMKILNLTSGTAPSQKLVRKCCFLRLGLWRSHPTKRFALWPEALCAHSLRLPSSKFKRPVLCAQSLRLPSSNVEVCHPEGFELGIGATIIERLLEELNCWKVSTSDLNSLEIPLEEATEVDFGCYPLFQWLYIERELLWIQIQDNDSPTVRKHSRCIWSIRYASESVCDVFWTSVSILDFSAYI